MKEHHPVLSPSYPHPHMYPPHPSESPQFCFDQSTLQLYGASCDRGRQPGGKSHVTESCDHCRSLPAYRDPTVILGCMITASSPNTSLCLFYPFMLQAFVVVLPYLFIVLILCLLIKCYSFFSVHPFRTFSGELFSFNI